MNERRFRGDWIVLPLVGIVAVVVLWAISSKTWAPNLPTPWKTWQVSQPYLTQPISLGASRANPTRHFSGVASGWFVYDYHGVKVINHSGGLDGMLSYTVLIPEKNAGFVILTNSESPSFIVMMNKIRDMLVDAPKRDWNAEAVAQLAGAKKNEADETKKIDDARIRDTKPSLSQIGRAHV